jgi:hypothetical protein
MYVVMDKGRSADDLLKEGNLVEGVKVEEMETLGEGEGQRTFLLSRPLKRD